MNCWRAATGYLPVFFKGNCGAQYPTKVIRILMQLASDADFQLRQEMRKTLPKIV